jgi:hypothetical protein
MFFDHQGYYWFGVSCQVENIELKHYCIAMTHYLNVFPKAAYFHLVFHNQFAIRAAV